MGLMLSILVACVGVLEVLEFIQHCKNALTLEENPNFSDISRCYSEELSKACLLEESEGDHVGEDIDATFQDGDVSLSSQIADAHMTYDDRDDNTYNESSVKDDIFEETKNKETNCEESFIETTPKNIKVQLGQNYEEELLLESVRKSTEKLNDEWQLGDVIQLRKSSSRTSLERDRSPRLKDSPVSSLKSSFASRPSSFQSSSIETNYSLPEIHFEAYEHGADITGDPLPYSEDFLRSLDGVKFKPLQRDDGTGRRKSFRKRHSSSSTSSRDSRASREEELRIFTSLEESEFENIQKHKHSHNEYTTTSEPNLKVKPSHRSRRKHGKSPIPDQHVVVNKETEIVVQDSIDEVHEDIKTNENEVIEESARILTESPKTHLKKLPNVDSFEEATDSQHEEISKKLHRSSVDKEIGKGSLDQVPSDDDEDVQLEKNDDAAKENDDIADEDTVATVEAQEITVEDKEVGNNTVEIEEVIEEEIEEDDEEEEPEEGAVGTNNINEKKTKPEAFWVND